MPTKKLFGEIARCVRNARAVTRNQPGAEAGVVLLAVELRNLFARLNPRFDGEWFLEACGCPTDSED